MMLPSAAVVPPIVLPEGPGSPVLWMEIETPSLPLPNGPVPAALRPMELPWIRLPLGATATPVGVITRTPCCVLPEITLRAPATPPPIVFDDVVAFVALRI